MHWAVEDTLIVWIALTASAGLALLAFRSMAYAFSRTVEVRSEPPARRTYAVLDGSSTPGSYFRSPEATMLMVEILLSVGIALVTVGLAAMAALPGRMMIGALLAQFAVLGALTAPPTSVLVLGLRLRPAAIALGVAQLANLVFFVHAIRALL